MSICVGFLWLKKSYTQRRSDMYDVYAAYEYFSAGLRPSLVNLFK